MDGDLHYFYWYLNLIDTATNLNAFKATSTLYKSFIDGVMHLKNSLQTLSPPCTVILLYVLRSP